ncbi:MAG: hypothetical protein ACTSV5_13960 [Promethearchaeota archaeon]
MDRNFVEGVSGFKKLSKILVIEFSGNPLPKDKFHEFLLKKKKYSEPNLSH